MASEDEVDYMSEEFLSECAGNNDIRPGLMHTHAMKRKHELEKKKKDLDETYRKKMRTIQEIQEEKLKEGLETPLDPSNKGFSLMQKMGYKSGMSLGKKGTGIVEPVAVVLKSDRIGLGWQQLLAEKRKRYEERKKHKRVEMDPAEYRAHMSSQYNQKLIEGDLRKSRKACYELDFKEGILNPHEFWFWPEHTWKDEDDDEDEYDEDDDEYDEDEYEDKSFNVTGEEPKEDRLALKSQELSEIFESNEQLDIITSYLRSTYLYCIWCCTEYEDPGDLENHCPGPTRADHDD